MIIETKKTGEDVRYDNDELIFNDNENNFRIEISYLN